MAAEDAACGAPGQADCPTQQWMKANLQAYLRTRDYKRLEASFQVLAMRAPDGYERWGELAKSGASASASGDEARVRKSCQECHDSYRPQFKKQLRSAQLL